MRIAALGVASLAAWCALMLRVAGDWRHDSDNAWQLLAAADLAAGNWTLRGWVLTPFSTWTSELPLYALAVRARGLDPGLVLELPVLLYGVAVLAAGWLAQLGTGPRPRSAAAIAMLLVGLPTPFLAMLSLRAGIPHMGTVAGSLLAIGLASRVLVSSRPHAWAAVGALVLVLTGSRSTPSRRAGLRATSGSSARASRSSSAPISPGVHPRACCWASAPAFWRSPRAPARPAPSRGARLPSMTASSTSRSPPPSPPTPWPSPPATGPAPFSRPATW